MPVDSYTLAETGCARVRLADREILVRSRMRADSSAVCLAVPRQSVHLHEISGAPSMRAQVSTILYLGDEIEATFRCDRGEYLVGRYAVSDARELRVGESVDIYLSPKRACLVTDDMMQDRESEDGGDDK